MAKKMVPSEQSLRVLFIGNSFTARNDLPKLIEQIAAADGRQLKHELVSAGGASLRMHWNKGTAASLIKSGQFDYVVLQEQSTLPIKNARRMHENVRLFDQRIKDAGAKTALYQTWARRDAPDKQDSLSEAYETIGHEIGATLIPAGRAWQACLRLTNHPLLHDRDGSHPTLAGSYLAACVAYAALFHRRPPREGVPVNGLATEQTAMLERCASQITL